MADRHLYDAASGAEITWTAWKTLQDGMATANEPLAYISLLFSSPQVFTTGIYCNRALVLGQGLLGLSRHWHIASTFMMLLCPLAVPMLHFTLPTPTCIRGLAMARRNRVICTVTFITGIVQHSLWVEILENCFRVCMSWVEIEST